MGKLPPTNLDTVQLQEPKLNPLLPSPAEALSSMAACTALDLVKDFTFVPFWVCGHFDLVTRNRTIQILG
jgi:hypothetical protein